MRVDWTMKVGQASSEYLVIIAVVLLVGLAGIGLLTFYSGTPGDAAMTESQIYWQSAAKPIKVTGAQSLYDTVSGKGGYSFSAENVDHGSLTLTGVRIDGVSREFKSDGSGINSSINIAGGEKKLLYIYTTSEAVPCVEGKQVELDVVFVYIDQYGSQSTQKGKSKIILRCSTSSSAASPPPPINQTNQTAMVQVWCYQETATQATACGAAGGGSYASDYAEAPEWHDGDWNTATELSGGYYGDVYVDYVKPASVNGTPMWKIKYGDPAVGPVVKPVPAPCYDAYEDALSFKITYSDETGLLKFLCYTGLVPNGGWATVWSIAGGRYAVYEEGLNWTLAVPG